MTLTAILNSEHVGREKYDVLEKTGQQPALTRHGELAGVANNAMMQFWRSRQWLREAIYNVVVSAGVLKPDEMPVMQGGEYPDDLLCRLLTEVLVKRHELRSKAAAKQQPLIPGVEINFGIVLNQLATNVHKDNKKWWIDLEKPCFKCLGLREPEEKCRVCHGQGYEPTKRNVGEMLMLVVSEVSEGMEGHRKGLMDDKLPHRTMLEVELADTMIRVLDIAHGLGLDIGGAVMEKLTYNRTREDHKIEARKGVNGKKC